MGRYSNHEQENLSKENEFLSFARKYKKQLLDTGLDSLKTAFKTVVHKTGEFLRNKFADVITNSYNGKIVKAKPIYEIIIPPEKREETFNKLGQVLQKWNIIKYLYY